MAGDYSRQTHDPRKRFAAVLMQQGRVQVDADWNEQATIALERARRQARDTFGRAAVSRFSTDQAFRIGIVPGPPRDLSIAPGRMYVEGLLAEAFATDGSPISYLTQAFLPDPPALPAQGGANVFLDVWQREITWVEDPALLDVALGGVDTAARLQTVWQVRVAAVRQAACGAELGEPSPARLTTRAVAPPAPEDPCLIAPKTGYRGLENRLYRVEVHTGGATAVARFKFSRDNASVRSPVTGMRKEIRGGSEVSILTVTRIGRDPGLRISAGDWVEITDEHRFLNGESGAMAQVAEPPLEEQGAEGFSVVLDRAIPQAGERAFAADAAGHAARRTRIIRWDQAAPRNTLDANGLMTVSGGMIELEEGVEVDFTLAGAGTQYRSGDWWVFAARTADASVEELTASPPHGPLHHVAQLAAVASMGANDDPSDCRTLWPPLAPQGGDGCCTVVVRPGEDVQAAIDSLPQAGGCVCLKAGVHPLRGPLVIRRSRVSLHAEAPGAAVLTRAAETPLLVIGGTATDVRGGVTDITVEGIVFQLGSLGDRATQDGLVSIAASAERVRIAYCRFVVQDFSARVPGLSTRGRDVTIDACIVEGLAVGILAEDGAADLSVTACAFTANPSDEFASSGGVAAFPSADTGEVAVAVLACTGRLRVSGNAISGYRFGVLAGDSATGGKGLATTLALIDDNIILRGGPRDAASAEDVPPPAGTPPPADTPGAATPGAATPGAATPGTGTPGAATPAPVNPRGTLGSDAVVSATRERIAGAAMRLSDRERIAVTAELPLGVSIAEEAIASIASRFTARQPEAVSRPALTLDTSGKAAAFPFAIVAAAQNGTVSENVIAWRGGVYGGILAGPGVRLVAGNDLVIAAGKADDVVRDPATGAGTTINQPGVFADAIAAVGIASGTFGSTGSDGVEISGNMVTGPAYAIAVAESDAVLIAGNLVVKCALAVLATAGDGIRVEGNGAIACQIGVMVRDAPRARVERNFLSASGTYGIIGLHAGTAASGVVRVAGNLLVRCGAGRERATAILYGLADLKEGKLAAIDSSELVVEANTVQDTGWPEDAEKRSAVAVACQLAAPRLTVHGNDVTWSQPAQTEAGLKLLAEERQKPNRAFAIMPMPGTGFTNITDGAWSGSLSFTDNRVRGPSADALVEVVDVPQAGGVVRFFQILVSGNLIEHWSPQDGRGNTATVALRAMPEALVSVSANVIRATGRTPSVLVDGPKQVAWAGNATSGPLAGAAGVPNVIA